MKSHTATRKGSLCQGRAVILHSNQCESCLRSHFVVRHCPKAGSTLTIMADTTTTQLRQGFGASEICFGHDRRKQRKKQPLRCLPRKHTEHWEHCLGRCTFGSTRHSQLKLKTPDLRSASCTRPTLGKLSGYSIAIFLNSSCPHYSIIYPPPKLHSNS